MTRVVIDTNVIVLALLQPLGPPAQVFLLAASGTVTLCITGNVYAEYEEVLQRPRFGFEKSVIAAALDTLRAKACWVKPAETVRACADPDDDIFLECAQAAGAAYLVTGNLSHFPEIWQETRIVTAQQFLQAIAHEDEST
jgi:uncharacterized protein